MTFPLDFDLLVIGVCTFIQNKKQKNKDKDKKNKKKTKKKKKKKQRKKTKQKKTKKKRKKKVQRYVCVSYLTPSVFVVGFIIGGLSEIFMRDELRESSLRSFVPWIMTDMYLI